MGYQESIIHTNLKNIEGNNREINQIISLFQKYGCRCEGDIFANCTHKLHFTMDVGKYKKDMDVLVVCGDRDVQRNPQSLFNLFSLSDFKKVDSKDLSLINKIKLTPLDDILYIIPCEESGEITKEELTLVPYNKKENMKELDLRNENSKDDIEL